MLLKLKMALLEKKVRQARMAVDLGWDPAKLSRIINGTIVPGDDDRRSIATYLSMSEAQIFAPATPRRRPTLPGQRYAKRRRES